MNHKTNSHIYILLFLTSIAVFLAGCVAVPEGQGQGDPTETFNLVTQAAPATAVPTATKTPEATATTAVSATSTATKVAAVEPTASEAACFDAAAFIADVTVPDGTSFAPSTGFNKTWRLKNSGTCTWDTGYKLVHAGGHRLGAILAELPLPASVLPGQMIDLTVSLVSPTEPATYQGDWKLQNGKGQPFGIGQNHNGPVWVKIVVATPQPANSGQISGFAWQDQDFDNQVEESEFLPNVSITLAAGANCGDALQTTMTDGNGRFQFTNLPAGDYCLIGSDGDVTVSQSDLILTENQQLSGVNVTWPPVWPESASISGWVWADGSGSTEADGMIQPDEPNIGGVTVKLMGGSCVGDNIPAQLVNQTNSAGNYNFEGLQPGVYCVFIDAAEASNVPILGNGTWTFPAYAVGYHEITLIAGEHANPVNFGWDNDEGEN